MRVENMPDTVQGKLLEADALEDAADRLIADAADLRLAARLQDERG